ncbi:GPI mannosyltransferase [Thraustotheca clavata]|uniref:Mannosyltransferase n=1 Tax=Thraustotheca clavata TaxID=74557 RepID=A0A1V9YS82_9STRA|nr:GPI mannosyltransferase [Thraustotheca clavata]
MFVAEHRKLLAAIILFRVANAWFVRTYYSADEFWQSSEVAHNLVYGYGTWEWLPTAQLRGYAHPALFALLYKGLQVLGLDTPWAVAYAPRLLQGVLAAIGDIFLYKLAYMYLDERAAKWALYSQLTSWFSCYTLVRTYSNSIEAIITTMALSYWPWSFQVDRMKEYQYWRQICTALSLAALGVVLRPTNAVIWLFLGLKLLWTTDQKLFLIFHLVLPIGIFALLSMLLIDRIGYGEWTFVPFNFVRFNVLEGKDALYGTHPWYWYFIAGFPEICAASLPFLAFGLVKTSRHELSSMILWAILVYSLGTHKEPRFLLPLLPPCFVYAGQGLKCLQDLLPIKLFRFVIGALVILNGTAVIYFGRYHQCAPLDVMDFLREAVQDEPDAAIDFFLPCHATPFYSHIHRNIPMWFPDCSPEFRDTGSESDRVRVEPLNVAIERYATKKRPMFLVMYSSTETAIGIDRLKSWEYDRQASFFHSQFGMDRDVPDPEKYMAVYRQRRS